MNPDIILFTGDIFDEHVERPDFDSFNAFFATLDPPGGKWFVLGNHDLFHTGGSQAMAARTWRALLRGRDIRILEDVSQLAYVGKMPPRCALWAARTWLYTQGNRFTPAS